MRGVGAGKHLGHHWWYAVAAHAGLFGFGHDPFSGPVDLVAIWEALGAELFSWGQHSHADIGDGVGFAMDLYGHQAERVACCEGV